MNFQKQQYDTCTGAVFVYKSCCPVRRRRVCFMFCRHKLGIDIDAVLIVALTYHPCLLSKRGKVAVTVVKRTQHTLQ